MTNKVLDIYKTTHRTEKKIKTMKNLIDTFPKMKTRWSTGVCKDAQHC